MSRRLVFLLFAVLILVNCLPVTLRAADDHSDTHSCLWCKAGEKATADEAAAKARTLCTQMGRHMGKCNISNCHDCNAKVSSGSRKYCDVCAIKRGGVCPFCELKLTWTGDDLNNEEIESLMGVFLAGPVEAKAAAARGMLQLSSLQNEKDRAILLECLGAQAVKNAELRDATIFGVHADSMHNPLRTDTGLITTAILAQWKDLPANSASESAFATLFRHTARLVNGDSKEARAALAKFLSEAGMDTQAAAMDAMQYDAGKPLVELIALHIEEVSEQYLKDGQDTKSPEYRWLNAAYTICLVSDSEPGTKLLEEHVDRYKHPFGAMKEAYYRNQGKK